MENFPEFHGSKRIPFRSQGSLGQSHTWISQLKLVFIFKFYFSYLICVHVTRRRTPNLYAHANDSFFALCNYAQTFPVKHNMSYLFPYHVSFRHSYSFSLILCLLFCLILNSLVKLYTLHVYHSLTSHCGAAELFDVL